MKRQKADRKTPFIRVMAALFVSMPIAYGLLVFAFSTTYHDVVYRGWHEVELPDAGTLYIPDEWAFSMSDEPLVNGVITGQAAGAAEGGTAAGGVLFVCCRYDDYRTAVREGAVFGDLGAAIGQAERVSGGSHGGASWSELEYRDGETGISKTFYQIDIYGYPGYRLISAPGSLGTSTVIKMALSFHSRPLGGGQ